MRKKTFDKQAYIAPSWEDMGGWCFDLAKTVITHGDQFDRIVALARGGLTMSRALADYLAISKISVTHIRFYSDIKTTQKQPVIIQSLPVTVEGERILLFDDIVDTGETLPIAKNYLLMCGAASVKTATLLSKPWTKFKPDYTSETTDAWVIFPHEVREMIELLYKKWHNTCSETEIQTRLFTLGLDKEQVLFFLKRQ